MESIFCAAVVEIAPVIAAAPPSGVDLDPS